MSTRKLIKHFISWCPQPSIPLSTKLKHYSVPIATLITVSIILSFSLSVVYSNLMFHPTLPQVIIPLGSLIINTQTAPAIAWVRNYTGQENADYASRIIQANDGGFVIAGAIGAHKYSTPEAWLVKIDSQGNIEWNQTFIIISENMTYKLSNVAGLVQTLDGGYVISGTEVSYPSGDYAFPPGNNFAILFKVDSAGNIEWNQTYSQLSGASFMAQTRDGGYAITGDYSLIKVDSSGKIQWQKSYESDEFGSNALNNHLVSGQQTTDGGYALLTSENTFFKVTSTGNLQWQQKYQTGTSYLGQPSYLSSFIPTSNSDYLLAGDLFTNNATDHIATLIKVDSNGKIDSSKTYGSLGSSIASLIQTSDGGYAFAGTLPNKGSNYPLNMVWIVKTDINGNQQWSATDNGTSNELSMYGLGGDFSVSSLIETSDGSLMVAGSWNPGATGLDNAYYVAKTEVILPPLAPTPSSTPTSPFFSSYNLLIIISILVVIIIVAAVAVIAFRKRMIRKF